MANGSWQRLPAVPVAPSGGYTTVWTGRQVLLFGRRQTKAGDVKRVSVAAAYDPSANSWRRLYPPQQPDPYVGVSSVWTGTEMLIFGPGLAYNPRTNVWRELPKVRNGFPRGIVVWTGREAIGWGGGCCCDYGSNGTAYNSTTGTYRNLPRSPLAGSQGPVGAWTGRELIIFVGNLDCFAKPWPARLARAAAYNPATNTWRRIARMPAPGGTGVWDGRELLVIGGGSNGRSALSYSPTKNHWRQLSPLPSSRVGAAIVWTGKQLLLWGGSKKTSNTSLVAQAITSHGLAYDPRADRWSTLPQAPLAGRNGATAVWTGREMIVWGGIRPNKPYGTGDEVLANGATFTPAAP